MTTRSRFVAVFGALVREEWRIHVTLFGGARFLLMPIFLSAAAIATAAALSETGTVQSTVVDWIHVFAIGFGLYSGTAGFAGSDMLEHVFGEREYLLGTAATVPVSRRVLLGLFLLKDALFYGGFVVVPLAVAVVPFVGLSAQLPAVLVGLWLSVWLAYVTGMVITVSFIAVRTRRVPRSVLVLVAASGAGGLYATGRYTDAWALVVSFDAGPLAGGLLFGLIALVGTLSLVVYDPTYRPLSRTHANEYDRISGLLPGGDPLVAKSLLDLHRSSGGLAKPFVSVGILVLVVAGLLEVVESITTIEPAPGLFFGSVLGLSAFTTYNWLTQFDDIGAYLRHPVSVEDVFRAKAFAFVVVGAPTVILPYLLSAYWFDATALDAITGLFVVVGYAAYYYGLTVFVAGFSPNEFLFDGARFACFGLGVTVVLLPTLLVSIAVATPTFPVAGLLWLASLALGSLGLVMTRRAARRWANAYAAGRLR